VLHTHRPGWHFTALYSNTARAHELDRVHDWVVLYAEDEQHHERPFTVVTAGRGALLGQRVVRGREDECRCRYAGQGAPAVPQVPSSGFIEHAQSPGAGGT
jgi:DNA polymerase (family 10)